MIVRKSSKVSHRDQSLQECDSEAKVPLKLAGSVARDKTWPGKARKAFIKKFYSPGTLATKSAKKRKVAEILEGLGGEPFPVMVESVTSLAAVLDSTGMKAGDQYLAEAKSMHVELGYDWDIQIEKQLSSCRRAMQCDKGPETLAPEVRIRDIQEHEWNRSNETKG